MDRRPVIGRSTSTTGAIALALALSGCGAAPTQDAATKPGRNADNQQSFESPARWASFPEAVGSPTATLVLGEGKCLVLTDDGQRWLVSGKEKAKPCSGQATASGSPSLEPLYFVERTGGGFRFVGEGGVVYASRDPIGPFERAVRAPSFLVRVAAGGKSVVGVDRAGRTFSFEEGAWKQVQPTMRAQGVDVAIDPTGRVLWLGAPETVLVSNDGGRTFTPPAGSPPTVGAWQAALLDGGKLGVLGIGSALALEGDRLVRSPTPSATPAARSDAEVDPVRGPKESQVRAGLAALTGKTYYEVVESSEPGGVWTLVRAELGELPQSHVLAGMDSCNAVRIAASGAIVALACMSTRAGGDLALRLDLSTDAGKTFTPLTELGAQTFGDVHLAVASGSDKGGVSVLVAGACASTSDDAPTSAASARPAAGRAGEKGKKNERGGCAPKAPVLVRREGKNVNVVEGAGAQMEQGSARSPALSPDGRVAYVLARTRREGRVSLFASRDGGRSYALRKLELPQGSGWDDGDEAEVIPSDAERMLLIPDRSRLTVDETGALGLACDGTGGPMWVTLDSDGRVQSSGRPPEGGVQMGGFGSRVLAVGFGGDDVLRAWESLDGGTSFTEIAVTQAVLRFANQGEAAMACSAGGCVLGDELVRIGWEGQAEAPFEMTEETLSAPDVSLAPSLSCRLVPKTDWTKIGGTGEDGAPGPKLPRLRDIARGKTAWSAVSIDPGGKVDVVSAPMPERSGEPRGPSAPGAIATKPLLAAPQGKGTALTVRPQAEGFVAMRAPVPRTKGGTVDANGDLDRVELGWHNQFLGVTARRTVRFDEKWSASLVAGNQLRPQLLTITSGGVTVRPGGKRATYFDAQGGASAFEYPAWSDLMADRRGGPSGDATLLGSAPAAIAFVDRSPFAQIFALARPSGGGKGFEVDARTLAPGHAELDWIASGDRSGVAALTIGSGQERAEAWLLTDKGLDAEPTALPRLVHLGDRAAPCPVDRRRTTPRSISAHFSRAGALTSTAGRRAVLVADASSGGGPLGAAVMEPTWLLTDGAALHGTPAEPCVAAWKASGVRNGAVAVITGDLDQAWLLKEAFDADPTPKGGTTRAPASPPRAVRVVLARPMTCKIDPSLPVPNDIVARAGQRMPDDQ